MRLFSVGCVVSAASVWSHFCEDMFGDEVGMFSESLARTFDSDSDGEIAKAGELRDSCKWEPFGTWQRGANSSPIRPRL